MENQSVTTGPESRPTFTAERTMEEETALLFDIGEKAWIYVTPILIFAGTIGNILSIATLQSKSFKGSASGFILSALAVADIMVLNIGALNKWLNWLNGVHVRRYRPISCKIHMYLTYLSLELSAWTLVVVTAERVVAVLWPLKAAFLCTKKRLALAWFLVLFLLGVVNMFILTETQLIKLKIAITEGNETWYEEDGPYCEMPGDSFDILYWTHLCLGSFFPSGLVFLGNAAIVYRLTRHELKRETMAGGSSQKTASSVTVMLVVVSVGFLVTTLPSNIFFLGADTWFADDTYETFLRRWVTFTFMALLAYLNSTLNFLFYFISGRRFRKAFLEMFHCRSPGHVSVKASEASLFVTKASNNGATRRQ